MHGTWIDATQGAEHVEQAVTDMLAESHEPNAEEWAIHDYEGFGRLRLGEYESLADVAKVARGIEQHGLAFAAWAEIMGIDDPTLCNGFGESYLGHWSNIEEYAEDFIESCGWQQTLDQVVPEGLAAYVRIDVEGFARDLQLGSDVTVVEAEDGGVWVFAP